MKRGWALTIAIVGMLTIGVAAAPAAKKSKTVTCTEQLTQQSEPGSVAPNPNATSGHSFGTVSCPKPFGHGVQADSFTVHITGPTTATLSGPFTQYFDTGTIHGTYSLAASASSGASSGTFKVTGGTGAYKTVKGHGPLNCMTSDGGIHTSCTTKLTMT